MSYALLVLRVVLGLLLAAHGAQKLFGWFGGGGLRQTGEMFGQLRFRTPLLMALIAGLSELGGGLLIATGLLTPLGAVAILGVMVVAALTVHLPNGLWAANGGYEYNVLIAASAVALATAGPGAFSLDALIGWGDEISGPGWAAGVVVLAALSAGATLAFGRRSPAVADRAFEDTATSAAH